MRQETTLDLIADMLADEQAAPQGAVDLYATRVLGRFHGILLETYTVLATVADGNCAYRHKAFLTLST